MSEQNPYEQLGVTENASFEEIQAAKKRLYEQYGNDSKVMESIEAAYDSIIMDRLRLRQEGKIKVPEKIRFPERKIEQMPNVPAAVTKSSPDWLQRFIDTPSQADILWPTGIFLVLAAIVVFARDTQDSLPSLLMALGFMANIYFLNRKEGRFGRSLAISAIALILGIAIGTGIAGLLIGSAGDGIVAGSGSEHFASAVTFCIFWLVSCFLR
jgi:hypothetical protein